MMPEEQNPWTSEAVNDLIQHFGVELLSASEVASILNKKYRTDFTRNSVIGKWHRLPAEQRTVRSVQARPARSESTPRSAPSLPVVRVAVQREKAKRERPLSVSQKRPRLTVVRRPVPDSPNCVPTRLMNLGLGQCKWPLGEINDKPEFFCGAHVEGGILAPYCDFHAHVSRFGSGQKAERLPETGEAA